MCVWCLSMSSDHLSCIKAQRCLLVLTKWWNSGIIRVLEISHLCITHTSDSRDEEKGQLTQPAVHFVVWEGTRSYHAFEEAKSDWWHECVAAVIVSSTFIKRFLSEGKKKKKSSHLLSKGWPKRVHNLRGSHYSIQLPFPHLLLHPEGKGGDRRWEDGSPAW